MAQGARVEARMIEITSVHGIKITFRHVALTRETTCAMCRAPILSASEVAAGMAGFHLFCAGCVGRLAEVLAGPVDGERVPSRRVVPGVLAEQTPQHRALKECSRFLEDASGPEATLLLRLVGRIEHGRGMVASDPDALDRERQDALINLLVVAAMVGGSEGV